MRNPKCKWAPAAPSTRPSSIWETAWLAKAMDDRVACAIIIEVLRRLEKTDNDIYAVFATQEEVGLRGARAAAYGISPDVGIALDVTRTGDTPKGVTMDVALGKGAIKVKDSSLICHPAQELHGQNRGGERHQVPDGSVGGGGTDSGAIQMTKSGIPAGVISIPCRYIHSPGEMVDIGDVEACVQLAKRTLREPAVVLGIIGGAHLLTELSRILG